jgi:hypothetical protein
LLRTSRRRTCSSAPKGQRGVHILRSPPANVTTTARATLTPDGGWAAKRTRTAGLPDDPKPGRYSANQTVPTMGLRNCATPCRRGRLPARQPSTRHAAQQLAPRYQPLDRRSQPIFERDTQKNAGRPVSRDNRIQTRPANQLRIHLRGWCTNHDRKQQRQIFPRCCMGELRFRRSVAVHKPCATRPARLLSFHQRLMCFPPQQLCGCTCSIRPSHNQSHVRKIDGDWGSDRKGLRQWCGCSNGHESALIRADGLINQLRC